MKRLLAVILLLTPHAWAHRLDEYLQATLLTLDRTQVQASIRLIPGIAIAPALIAAIDTDRDGLFSPAEQQAYANLILAGLTLTADNHPLHPTLLSTTFPTPAQMREGLAEIHLDLTAPIPASTAPHRTLTLANNYRSFGSAYLVNALAPTDPAIHITAQIRNEAQSLYRLDYTQSIPTRRTPILAAAVLLGLLGCGWRLARRPA